MIDLNKVQDAEQLLDVPERSGVEARPYERTPEIIGREIRQIQQQFRTMTVLYAVEAGRRLCEAKEMLPHGEFLEWVKNDAGMSHSSASRLMKIFREYSDEQITLEGAVAKSSTLKNLSVSNALRLLAIPEEEREAFAEEHDVEHLSARELDRVIAERDAARLDLDTASGKLADAEKEVDKLAQELRTAREKVRELEERPVPVAVETDEDAVVRAVETAKAEAMKDLERLQKKLDAAEKKQQKAEEAAKAAEEKAASAAGDAAKERDALAKELENVKRQLAQSDAVTVQFKVIFETVQGGMNELLRLIRQAEEPSAGKLRKAAEMLLEQFGKQVQG